MFVIQVVFLKYVMSFLFVRLLELVENEKERHVGVEEGWTEGRTDKVRVRMPNAWSKRRKP